MSTYVKRVAVTCPFCGCRVTPNNHTHFARCPHDPAHHDRYAAALANPAHPGWCYTCTQYDVQHPKGLYGSDALRRSLGMTWDGVARHFGLEPAPHGQGMRDAAQRRVSAKATLEAVGQEIDEALADAAVVEDEWEAARYGLPVLRYRTQQIGSVYQRVYEIR